MHQQIRKSVFETNSSSSHSLTLGKGDLVALPFPAKVLRKGVIEVSLQSYGWEWARYYTARSKMEYLLTQLLQCEKVKADGLTAQQFTQEARACDERVDMLCRVVKNHTGCDVLIEPSMGDIDHESSGVGTELFQSEEGLRAFLFDESAYIETGNDNSEMPWLIASDKGKQLAYLAHISEVPEDAVTVEVTLLDQRMFSGAAVAKNGGLVPPRLRKKLAEKSVALKAHIEFTGKSALSRFSTDKDGARTAALGTLSSRWTPQYRVAATFTASSSHKATVENYSEATTLTLAVPQQLADALSALEPLSGLEFQVQSLEKEAQYWEQRARKDAKTANPAFSAKRHAAAVAELEKAKATLARQKKAACKKAASADGVAG